jgi:ATP synthase protein I
MLAQRNRTAAATTGLAGVLAVLLSWAAVGSRGPGSALLGVIMVLVFFGAGSLPFVVAGDGTQGRSGFAFLVLGMTYVLRILLGVGVYVVASESDSVNSTVVGLTVIGCALVWTNTQLFLGLSRRHRPTLEL